VKIAKTNKNVDEDGQSDGHASFRTEDELEARAGDEDGSGIENRRYYQGSVCILVKAKVKSLQPSGTWNASFAGRYNRKQDQVLSPILPEAVDDRCKVRVYILVARQVPLPHQVNLRKSVTEGKIVTCVKL